MALAQCATNAYNALVLRHLAEPTFVARLNGNPFLEYFGPQLRARYFQALQHNLEQQWRVGKKVAKLCAIDQSTMFDPLATDRARSFVKFEVNTTTPKKARLIQGNTNEFTAYQHPEEYTAFAQALKEPLLATVAGTTFEFHYAGGHDHDHLSDLFSEAWHSAGKNAYLDERDGKNWDSTMQEATLRAEAAIYKFCGMKAYASFMARSSGVRGSIFTKDGKMRAVLRYLTSWKRLSGDWNTSVGNTIISMLIVFIAILELPPHLRPSRVVGFFMGDDYLGIYSHPTAVDPIPLTQALNANEQKCGITPVRCLFTNPLHVSFISLGLWPRSMGGYQFVPHPAKQLVKLFVAARAVPQRLVPDYQTALAIAFWPVYWGFPLMMRFLKAHYVKPTTRMSNPFYFSSMLSTRVRDVLWAEGFSVKYGLPMTSTYFDIPQQHCFLSHPVVDHMLRFEVADPDLRLLGRGNFVN